MHISLFLPVHLKKIYFQFKDLLHNDTTKEIHQQSNFQHNSAAEQIVVNTVDEYHNLVFSESDLQLFCIVVSSESYLPLHKSQ